MRHHVLLSKQLNVSVIDVNPKVKKSHQLSQLMITIIKLAASTIFGLHFCDDHCGHCDFGTNLANDIISDLRAFGQPHNHHFRVHAIIVWSAN